MPGQFNPDKNLFSVAPVGQIVIIGRSMVLRGGLTREQALNLLTWLIIGTSATPEEIAASVQDSMVGTPNLMRNRPTVASTQRAMQSPPPKAPVAQASEVAPEVSGQVTPYIGPIDAEEAEGIQAALVAPRVASPVTAIRTIDPAAVAGAWGKAG
jgi:hypothetical protein